MFSKASSTADGEEFAEEARRAGGGGGGGGVSFGDDFIAANPEGAAGTDSTAAAGQPGKAGSPPGPSSSAPRVARLDGDRVETRFVDGPDWPPYAEYVFTSSKQGRAFTRNTFNKHHDSQLINVCP